MKTLYCVILKDRFTGNPCYLLKRIPASESSPYSLFIQYARVSTYPEILEKKIEELRERFPAEIAGAKVRPLNKKELASYEYETADRKDWLEKRKRISNLSVKIHGDDDQIIFFTKKNPNIADLAAIGLFKSLGMKVGNLNNGGLYAEANFNARQYGSKKR